MVHLIQERWQKAESIILVGVILNFLFGEGIWVSPREKQYLIVLHLLMTLFMLLQTGNTRFAWHCQLENVT